MNEINGQSNALPESLTALNSAAAEKNFSKAADSYDEFAFFQSCGASELLALLAADFPPEFRNRARLRILEPGCGSGMVTQELLRLFPAAELHACDISEAMLEVCARKFPDALSGGRLRLRRWDFNRTEEDAFPDAPFDLIVSGMALQWTTDLGLFLRRALALFPRRNAAEANALSCAALPQAGLRIFFSIPLDGTFDLLRGAFRAAGLPYPGLALPTEEALSNLLEAIVAEDPQKRRLTQRTRKLLREYPSMRAFLTSLERSGTGNASSRPVPPGILRSMLRNYNHRIEVNYNYSLVSIFSALPDTADPCGCGKER